MNSDGKFAAFYISVISAALVGSLYANHLDSAWNRKVFTFPPETQKVVENGTAIMEVSWRWLPETLEMIVKVNDDETNTTFITTWKNQTYHNRLPDCLCFLFDSDNNGRFSNSTTWKTENDHGVGISTRVTDNHTSAATEHCWLDKNGHIRGPLVWCDIYTLVYLDNSTSRSFKEGEGYTFKLSIPIELINVKHPTTVQINFWDGDCELSLTFGEDIPYDEARLFSTLVAELEM